MSSIVKDIREGIEGVCATNLPGYTTLKHKFNIEKNDNKANKKSYGVESMESVRLSGTTNTLTLEQRFRVSIVDDFRNRGHGDSAIQTTIDELNDKAIEIARDVHLSKAGVSGVLVANLDSVEEPEILDDNEHIVILRFNVLVQYRQSVK